MPSDGPEVLLVQRNPEQRFMGGAWVFPGGATHDEDADHAATAVRELEEEAGVRLGDAEPVAFSRWITPREVKVRFDTWFFVAEAPAGAEPRLRRRRVRGLPLDPARGRPRGRRARRADARVPDDQAPRAAGRVRLGGRGAGGGRERVVEPIEPRVVARDGVGHVLLPGEPGYDEA